MLTKRGLPRSVINRSSLPPLLLYARVSIRIFSNREESVKIIAVFSEADVNFDATNTDINSQRVKKKISKHSRQSYIDRYKTTKEGFENVSRNDPKFINFEQIFAQRDPTGSSEKNFSEREEMGGGRHVGVVRSSEGSTYRW